MLTPLALATLAETSVVFASSSSNTENALYLLLLGPAAAVGFYSMIYLRYRNTDKRYEYERKTSADVGEISGFDRPVGQIRGVAATRIQGDNSRSPRTRLGRNTTVRQYH